MRIHFTTTTKILGATLAALSLFASGYVAGENKFGQPKTIIHMVILKWRPGVADADKQRALEGVKEMAAKVPGIKNIWIKADRIQPRDFNAAYAIEFKDRDAADAWCEAAVWAEGRRVAGRIEATSKGPSERISAFVEVTRAANSQTFRRGSTGWTCSPSMPA